MPSFQNQKCELRGLILPRIFNRRNVQEYTQLTFLAQMYIQLAYNLNLSIFALHANTSEILEK